MTRFAWVIVKICNSYFRPARNLPAAGGCKILFCKVLLYRSVAQLQALKHLK